MATMMEMRIKRSNYEGVADEPDAHHQNVRSNDESVTAEEPDSH